jgi:hypothetical protein
VQVQEQLSGDVLDIAMDERKQPQSGSEHEQAFGELEGCDEP